MVVFILSLSLLLQLLAIYFALSLIRLTGRRLAWGLIASAIALMALRRGISLAEIVVSGQAPPGDLIVELVALTISALMAVGIARVTPIFREIRSIADRLRKSENRFRALYESSPDAVFIIDSEQGRIAELNPQALRLTGMRREELIGGNLPQFDGFDASGEIGRRLKDAWGGAPSPSFESAIRGAGGVEVPVEVSLHSTESGDQRLLQAIFRDITERKQAEIVLHESEERYRTLITGMSEGVVMQGPDGVVLTCNPSAERILGLTHKEMIGRTAADPRWEEIREDGSAFPEEENPALVALRTGLPQTDIVMGLKKPDAHLVWVSINAQPLFELEESRPYAVVVTFNDITERKKNMEKLAQHMDELERFQKATVDREFRIKQLRDEVAELKERLKDQ